MVYVSDLMVPRPKSVSLKICEMIKLTFRPSIQQHQTPLLPAKRKGAYRPHSRSPQSAHHARKEEDLCKLSGSLRDEL
jgi:hypothetical protein